MSVTAACAHKNDIPNVTVYKEIPFLDAPEAAFIETLSHKEGLLGPDAWEAKRPFTLCVDDAGWAQIKLHWLKACAIAGPDCNVMVDSVDQLVRQLDQLAKQVLRP